uniref:Arginine vasopressin receptor 2b, tandem duplicate, 1 n=1 Tax=Amphiprion percula TaxID=161767 RepID=A0A3P8U4Y5_AMPPE
LGPSGALSGDEPRDERLAQVEIALLSIIFITAGILNFGLLLVLWKRRKQLSRMRVFVFHLCVADLVVTFFQVCPQLMWDITDRFIGPVYLCRVVKYLQVVGMFASTYMIVVMTRRRARWNGPVCAAWCVSLIGGLPQIFIFSRVEFIKPWGPRAYVTWTTLVIFILPILTVIVCQVRICRTVHINFHMKTHHGEETTRKALSSRASSVAGVSKARVKSEDDRGDRARLHHLLGAFLHQNSNKRNISPPVFPAATFTILMLLASLNSCANPCIYLLFCGKLPKRLVTLMCRGQPDSKESIQEEATMVSSLYISLKNLSDFR